MFSRIGALGIGLSFSFVAAALARYPNVQTPLGHASYADGLFTPVESLSAVSSSEFTTLGHPFFPNYSVRIRKSQFCDGTVKCAFFFSSSTFGHGTQSYFSSSFTGYIDIEARHLFFYFFESRNDPATDDVIFWTNGGKAFLSSFGLLYDEEYNHRPRVFLVSRTVHGAW